MTDADTSTPSVNRLSAFLMLLFLSAALFFAVYQHRPPSPVPKTALPTTFSAERALEHIRAVAQKPHPAGTPENAAVREYIRQSISRLGVPVEIQETFHQWKEGHAATVQNVLARIPGSASTGSIALVGHYDSVEFGPGAGDDASAVATLLETMRALKAGLPLKNDVIFLFADGEEGRLYGGTGLCGARAFVELHPWAKEVAVAVNFDCRGNKGVSYMYETGPENGWLIEQLAKAGCHPVASSLMCDVYRSMPVDTDYTAFRNAGIPGLNCAFIDGLRIYHTALDTLDHLSPASLQHHGDYALNLVRRLGNLPLTKVRKPDAVYFNTLGYRLAYYPMSWAVPLAGFVLVVFVAVLALGLVRRKLTVSGIFKGLAVFLACALVLSGLAALMVAYGYKTRWVYILYTENTLTLALLALTACTVVTHLPWLTKRINAADLAASAMLPWAILTMGAAFLSPGASYLFTWPLLFSSLGFLFVLLARDANRVSFLQVVALALTSLPAILLIGGIMVGLQACVTVIGSPLAVFFWLLLLGLLIPHLRTITSAWAWLLPVVTGAAAVVCFWFASTSTDFSAAYPKLNSITYGLDTNTGKAYWMSCDKEPDEWTSQFLPSGTTKKEIREFFPDLAANYLKASAFVAPLDPPDVALLSDVTENGVRKTHFHVTSPRQAPLMDLYAGEDTQVVSASVDGHALKPVEGRWFLWYTMFPRNGIELALEVNPATPLTLRAVEHTYGLPDIPGFPVKKRPDYMIPKPNTVDYNKDPLKTDETLVAKVFRF